MNRNVWSVMYSAKDGKWHTFMALQLSGKFGYAPALWDRFEDATAFADLLKKGIPDIDKVLAQPHHTLSPKS